MTKREVRRRLDEIIEFAGLQQFMDTPVKRYSSGMYLRLGFAIAAHMEAEILLVDEVLAVGDVEFQRRCLGKMNEVEQSGRTVLFVSHNMDAMARLCPKVVWLDRGAVAASGPAEEVITRYLSSSTAPGAKATIAEDPTMPAQVTGVSAVSTKTACPSPPFRAGRHCGSSSTCSFGHQSSGSTPARWSSRGMVSARSSTNR